VSDQTAQRVDHVRVPRLADPDLGDDVPDDLEVDLGGRHLGAGLPRRHRDDHVGLGLVPEVHGTEVRRPRPGLGELGRLRRVLLTADRVQGDAGHPELFLARPVEVRDLTDRGGVAEEPQVVDLALLARRGGIVEGGLDRPADQPLDVPDEQLDPRPAATACSCSVRTSAAFVSWYEK
jgi:hypothetical protein